MAQINTEQGGALLTWLANGSSGGTSEVDSTPFAPAVSSGTPVMAYDPTSGELVIIQTTPGTRKLAVDADVTVTPTQSSTASAPAQTTVGTTAGQVLAANTSRKRMMFQNVGTTVIKLAFGATPTQTAFHVSLAPGGTAGDGSSRMYTDDMWTGAVQAISSASGGLLVVTELT